MELWPRGSLYLTRACVDILSNLSIRNALGLLGTQKAFSCEPSLAIITVSAKAWKQIEKVAYTGYDALLPFKDIEKVRAIFPYYLFTPRCLMMFVLSYRYAKG